MTKLHEVNRATRRAAGHRGPVFPRLTSLGIPRLFRRHGEVIAFGPPTRKTRKWRARFNHWYKRTLG